MADADLPTREQESNGAVIRIAKVASGLLDVHVEIAKREASRDRKRLASAAGAMAFGALLVLLATMLLDAAAVFAVHDRARIDWPLALLAVGGADGLVGAALFLAASRGFKAPVMPETRSLVKKTYAALTE